jgi:iron complex outermembrane receptor protein
MRNVCRTLIASIVVAFLAAGTLAFADVEARSIRYDLNIPSEDLTAALQSFAIASHHKLLYKAELTTGKTSRALQGHFTAQEAMEALLSGTGLSYEITESSVVLIKSKTDAKTSDLSDEGALPASAPVSQSGGAPTFLVAQSNPTASSSGNSANPLGQGVLSQESASVFSDSEKPKLNEIVVTAQKRQERLQDVPIPVTAINADALVDNNQLRIQDYYTSVPGLSLTPAFQNAQVLTIRGISAGVGSNPTVGITVDDVPYGSSQVTGGGQMVPDIDPGDLARIEVLRGPQGTLYGASSMGGLLKFVTVDPSTDRASARVQAGLSGVHNGAQLGYNVRGAVNVPLSDTLAVRLSGFTHEDPGYIDDPALHLNGVNKTTAYGGLLSALWRPSDVLSLKVTALLQDIKADGSNDVEPALGDLHQSGIPGVGGSDRKAQAYSATLTAKLGGVNLTAVSGYNTNSNTDTINLAAIFSTPAQNLFGVTGSSQNDSLKNHKYSQEIRLSAPIGQRFEWLLGGFYTYEDSHWVQRFPALNPATGAAAGQLLYNEFPTIYAEYAGFADLTVHVTDRFDVQLGGREAHIRQTFSANEYGPLIGTDTVTPEEESKSNAFTYLLTPQFKVSSDFMVYARLASGYRPGGPNANCVLNHLPCQYDPDKTKNYEVGAKGDFLDRRLSVDASLYYIGWKNIQLVFAGAGGGNYYANGSAAKSQGIELSVQSRPLTGLTIAGWVTWDEAVITEPTPPGAVQPLAPGERLPLSPRFSANFSAEQKFPLSGRIDGFIGGDVSYVGNRASAIGASGSQIYPSYTKADLRAGAKYDSWTVNLFATNVGDTRGILSGGVGTLLPNSFYYIPPRMVGLNIVRTF